MDIEPTSHQDVQALNTPTNLGDANATGRFWCFTINNPVSQFTELPEGVRYLISGKEVSSTGTPHLQCYVELERARRRVWLSKRFIGAGNIQMRYKNSKGSDCIAYCKKGEQSHEEWTEHRINGPMYGTNADFIEIGDAAKVDQAPGKRNDLAALCTMIADGCSMKEVAQADPPTFARNCKGLGLYKAHTLEVKSKFREFNVNYVYGKTRLGKSFWVSEKPNIYTKPIGKALWFDNYDQEETVCFEEFHGNFPLNDMLRLLDPIPLQVQTKGGHVLYQPNNVYLTSNMHPYGMYAEHSTECRDAFFARLRCIIYFYDYRKYHVLDEEQRKAFLNDPNWYPVPFDLIAEGLLRVNDEASTRSARRRLFNQDMDSDEQREAVLKLKKKPFKKRKAIDEPENQHPLYHAQAREDAKQPKINVQLTDKLLTQNPVDVIDVIRDSSSDSSSWEVAVEEDERGNTADYEPEGEKTGLPLPSTSKYDWITPRQTPYKPRFSKSKKP